MQYIVLDSFSPWIRGGCIACSRGQGGVRCGEDVYPSNRAQRIVEVLQPPFFLAGLVFWLFLASMVFGITLFLVHVCLNAIKIPSNVVMIKGSNSA